MTEDSFEIISRDGLKLNGMAWLPEAEPAAMICLVHGHGEHIGRYAHVGSFFAGQGIAVFGMDLRGHGKSEGRRGHAPAYDYLLEDVEDLMKKARVEYIETPMFLYGHSMGGNIVANFLTARKTLELHGAILSSPWLRLAFQPSPVMVAIGKVLRRVWPSFTAASGLDTSQISSIPAEVEKYRTDPLIHDKITAQLSLSVMEAGEGAIEKADQLNIPVLAFHGADDKITSPAATMAFAERCPNSTFKLWEGLRHETHNDTDAATVLRFVSDWLMSKL